MAVENKWLVVALIAFLVLSQISIFVIKEDVWFDVAFTTETVNALRQNGLGSIDWVNYDVHPPTLYIVLYFWSFLNPGLLQSTWLREFFVVCGMLFLIVAYSALKDVFGEPGEVAIVFLSISTMMIHYGQETRMYMLLMLISAIVFFAITKRLEKWWFVVGAGGLAILPNIHYFAGMATLYFPLVYMFYWITIEPMRKKIHVKRAVGFFLIGVSGIAFAFFKYALPQFRRSGGTWLRPASLIQFPASLTHTVFFTDEWIREKLLAKGGIIGNSLDILLLLLFVVTVVGICVLTFMFIKWIMSKEKSGKRTMKVMMGVSALFPLGALVLCDIGKLPLYHPRYFLVVTWLFGAMILVVLAEFLLQRRIWWYIGTLILFGLMFTIYVIGTNHDLLWIQQATPCDVETIVHESPFSMISFMVYAREHGCEWRNVLSTDVEPDMGRAGGFDAIEPEDIYWNLTWPEGEVLYVHADENRTAPRPWMVIYVGDGIELWKVEG